MTKSADDGNSPESAPEAFVFQQQIVVVEQDIDGLGHVNNVVYLRWTQEVATAHWLAATTPQQRIGFSWVALRHEIDYLKPAYVGQILVARTHVGTVTGARFERFVEIYRAQDDAVVSRARSVWVAVDSGTKKPRRIDPSINKLFYSPV